MKYKKNFLTKVVLRFDFASVPVLLADRKTPFSDAIKERFPTVNAAQAAQLQLMFGSSGSGFEQKVRGWVWTHTTANGKRTATLSADSLAVEVGAEAYVDFTEFRTWVEYILAAFNRHVGVIEYTRIGLRYINEIHVGGGNPLDWRGIVAQHLCDGVRAGFPTDLQLTRSMHQIAAVTGDMSLLFNYGINNPDFPSPVAQRLFVLDYDAFTAGGIPAIEAIAQVTSLNDLCARMFEASIENGLRERMEAIQ